MDPNRRRERRTADMERDRPLLPRQVHARKASRWPDQRPLKSRIKMDMHLVVIRMKSQISMTLPPQFAPKTADPNKPKKQKRQRWTTKLVVLEQALLDI